MNIPAPFKRRKEPKGDKILARYIFEVRFGERIVSFLDQRGKILEIFLKEFNLDRYVMTEERIEATDENQALKVFFSSQNFGLQLEGSDRLEDFNEIVVKLIKIVQEAQIAAGRPILRLGTKSEVYFHPGGKNFSDLKAKYMEKVTTGASAIGEAMGAGIVDMGMTLIMRDEHNRTFNISTGPMEMKQITSPPFFSSPQVQKNKGSVASCGIFLSTDSYITEKGLKLEGLESIANEQIQNLNEKVKGFLSWIVE